MNRPKKHQVFTLAATLTLRSALPAGARSSADGTSNDAAPRPIPAVSVAAVAATEQPIARFIRATGTLMAEEQADVAAETAGPVVSAPVEGGAPGSPRAA